MAKRPRSRSQDAKGSGAERRRAIRFNAFVRADYELGDRSTFGYSSNLSAGGLLLRGATHLEVGQPLAIALHLKSEPQPVKLKCVVRTILRGPAPGAGLEFLAGQDKAIAAVRRYIDEQIVAGLEASLARSLSNVANVCLLGGYYVEVGRTDDAVDLYRRALDADPAAM